MSEDACKKCNGSGDYPLFEEAGVTCMGIEGLKQTICAEDRYCRYCDGRNCPV